MPLNPALGAMAAAAETRAKRLRLQLEEAVVELRPYERALRAPSADALEAGHRRVEGVFDTLRQFELRGGFRSDAQVIVHDMFTSACAGALYMGALDDNKLVVQQRFGWTEQDLNEWVYVQMPRRHGKTHAVAQFLCAALLNRPCVKVLIFAPAFYQSKLLLAAVAELLEQFFPDVRVDASSKRIIYRVGPGDVRSIVALPAVSKNRALCLLSPNRRLRRPPRAGPRD